MGIIGKLFGTKAKETEAVAADPFDCLHATLVPRWENVKDMGIEDKVTRYRCEACHQEFSPEEGRQLLDTVAERLAAQDDAGRSEATPA